MFGPLRYAIHMKKPGCRKEGIQEGENRRDSRRLHHLDSRSTHESRRRCGGAEHGKTTIVWKSDFSNEVRP